MDLGPGSSLRTRVMRWQSQYLATSTYPPASRDFRGAPSSSWQGIFIWNLYSIVYMEYSRYIPIIYRETIYLRYIPVIYLHDKSDLSVGFNACIACLGCALRYTHVFKDWISSMLKIQSSNHFCGICLKYAIFRPVYHFHIYNSGLVLVNSQNHLEADS